MKKLFILSFAIATALFMGSCGGGDDAPSTPTNPTNPTNPDPVKPTEPVYPTYDTPTWQNQEIQTKPKYEVSVSAYVTLPDSLVSTLNDNDQLAVFSGSECRGFATRDKLAANVYVWSMLVSGKTGDVLTFQYYSATSKHMYKSENVLTFNENEKSFGNVDNPIVLGMRIVEK